MVQTLSYDQQRLAEICQAYHIRRLEVFGSRARGETRADSDVDLLADYDPGGPMTMFRFLDLEAELQEVFPGLKVDLVSRNGLSPYLKDEILRTTQVLYEQ